MVITEPNHGVTYSHSTSVPLKPLGSVDLVPAADPPALGHVVLKTFLHYHQPPLSGSKPVSTSWAHTPIASFLLVFYPVCYAPMPRSSLLYLLTSLRFTLNHRRNTCFSGHDYDTATATPLVRARHFPAFLFAFILKLSLKAPWNLFRCPRLLI